MANADAVLKLQAATLSRPTFEEAAAAFATGLAELLELDRVCVGLIENGFARVVALSHGAALDTQQELNRDIAAAMDEAIDQAATISFPSADAPPHITLAQAALARRSSARVCSIPIVNLGTIVGAVTLESGSEQAFTREKIEVCEHIVSLVGPVLALKFEIELDWTARAGRALRLKWTLVSGPGELPLKLAIAAIALFLIIASLIPMPYHANAPARLEASVQRALVAASDGFIQQVSVRPGDAVRKGQVLAELALQELELERSKWDSELAQQVNSYGAALARADRALLMVNHARISEVRAQLELVEKQIERAHVRAPFDGVVISGDLTQSLGAPVQRGAVLMVVAPHERFRLIVEVDERDVGDIRSGATGRISLAAMPGAPLSFRILRVAPLAATREGRHFFEAEGELDATGAALRPGLQGVARIRADDRSLASMAFGDLLKWLQLRLWSLGVWG
jgi:multidrug efflux pump subunit AcrA (membrane-fusion protein)